MSPFNVHSAPALSPYSVVLHARGFSARINVIVFCKYHRFAMR